MHHPSYFRDPRDYVSPQHGTREQSYVNPHAWKRKQDILDHYKIGDIYDRFDGLRKGTFGKETPNDGPYLRYLKKISRNGWANILYLADFVEASTVPIKKHLLSKEDFEERYSRTNVTILDYHNSSGLHVQRITSAPDLVAALEPSAYADVKGHTRFILTADISSTTIEALGSHLSVDPRAFRDCLADYQWYHVRDPWYNLHQPTSSVLLSSFFTVLYPRLFYMPDRQAVERVQVQTGSFNVQRSILIDQEGSWTERKGSRIGNLRTTMAYWERPREEGRGELGVLVLDPDVDAKPLWADFQTYAPPPSLHDPVPETTGYETTMDKFVNSARTLIGESRGNVRPIDLVAIQLRASSDHWQILMQYAETRMSIIEWALQPPTPESARSLEDTLKQLNPWRRRMPLYQNLLTRTVRICEHQASLNPLSKAWSGLCTDFRDLDSRRSVLEARVDRITATMTAIIAIDENKKATNNANDVARITYLAFVFVPLSFLTGIFSMDRGFPHGGTMVYWVFAALGVPFAGIPLLVALNWEGIRRRCLQMRRKVRVAVGREVELRGEVQ